MKRILGLDLGTNSIGWALVNEKENDKEQSSIVKLGVRIVPLTVDENNSFEKGKKLKTPNALRTEKRGIRRNLQRYKLRRDKLITLLKERGIIDNNTKLSENGKGSTFENYQIRAKAATEQVTLEEFARMLIMINKKRGYKSNRKVKSQEEDGQVVDGLAVAKELVAKNLTPGQYVLYNIFNQGNRNIPDFYPSDLQNEFDRIWNFQKEFYPNLLTQSLKKELYDKNEKQTWAICEKTFGIKGIPRTKGLELKKENYKWRVLCLSEEMDLERLTVVFQEINKQLKNSSGYLGNISDRSKELYFNNQTIGQYKMSKLATDPNSSLKNKVFYRQDYLNEFEKIWDTQSLFHKELTPELKHEIRDKIIFYQRPLKSQKGSVNFCELESEKKEFEINGKKVIRTIGARVCPKSSPLYQEFRIWQVLNNVQIIGISNPEDDYKDGKRFLKQEEKETLYQELSIKEKLSNKDILKILSLNSKEFELNYKEIKGNITQANLYKAYNAIMDLSGHNQLDFSETTASKIKEVVTQVFKVLGINTDILTFDTMRFNGKDLVKQPAYELWHLLYSYEGDKSISGNEKLIEKLSDKYGFKKEFAKELARLSFEPDYGNLSAKAIRRILPYMKEGEGYSDACEKAGYKHSKRSLTKEENEHKVLKEKLELLPQNSLRNPVVEKILNQMIHVVNSIVKEYGKIDEIRVEMARELKSNREERERKTKSSIENAKKNEEYEKILHEEFGLGYVSKNDILRYKLYRELEKNNYKTLYTNTYIPQEKLFSKDFDIEHIIPQAKLFDNSFANKTLESRTANIEKGDMTAYDYVLHKYGENAAENYKSRIDFLLKTGVISKTKHANLLKKEQDITGGFIERDLRDTQYISRKAIELLEGIARTVTPTTGSITKTLREDWQLVDVMKELNWNKYKELRLTEEVKDGDGMIIRKIKDWTKRNDHRHHAMDALTIAFTKRSYIQYLNNKQARSDKNSDIYKIEREELYRGRSNKLLFIPPMPLDEFRNEAKRHLENILVSIKSKNKVMTPNIYVIKKQGIDGVHKERKIQLTPRGQLHNDTIYGSIKKYVVKKEKVNGSFGADKIKLVANAKYRKALLLRYEQFGRDAETAFSGKNSLSKNPIFVDEMHTMEVPKEVKTVKLETVNTQRVKISKDLKKTNDIVDKKIKSILQERLKEYNNEPKVAFVNLDQDPIWLNKEKGISIKHVTIFKNLSNSMPIHDKRNHKGELCLDRDGKKQPTDYVNPDNNHHVAIYKDTDGNLQEKVVSFFETTERARQGIPVVDKEYHKEEGWTFLFTMKQNDYFVFPNTEKGFLPNEIDLLDEKNYAKISPNLYRVQKLSSKNYCFRHHLETTIDRNLPDITYKSIRTTKGLTGIIKVRVDHLGRIVHVGEF